MVVLDVADFGLGPPAFFISCARSVIVFSATIAAKVEEHFSIRQIPSIRQAHSWRAK